MHISIVIPVLNEVDSLKELASRISGSLDPEGLDYEVICVDDGSTDGSWNMITEIAGNRPDFKGIKFRRNYGKSAALHKGFEMAAGEIVVMMDADLQDDPCEIPSMYRMIRDEGYDLVSGWKKKRLDPLSKKIPSRFYNFVARKVTGIRLHDFNCGLKAFRKEVVKSVEIYGEMHRYIPVIVRNAGFTHIGEKTVRHCRRKYGKTKFGADRYLKGFLDLLSITFMSRFGKRPMHLFGTLGTLMFLLGFIGAGWLGGQKLYHLRHHIPTILVTESPYFYLALTAMIIGTQLFLAGFLGELISRSSSTRNVYDVEKKINIEP